MRAALLRLTALCFPRNKHDTTVDITFSQLRWLRTNSQPTQTTHLHTDWFNCLEQSRRNYNTPPSSLCATLSYFALHRILRKMGHLDLSRNFANQEVPTATDDKRLTIELSPLHRGQGSETNLGVDTSKQGSASDIVDVQGVQDLPEMSRTVYNLSPYVQKSETLQNLVRVGVDLSRVEKFKGMANTLLMSHFDRDILPYLRHLAYVGVAPDKLGYILSINPMVLTENLDQLQQRVGYLLAKDFTMDNVASMYTRAPVMIRMSPLQLDRKLGFLQQAFSLTDLEVRQVALTFPKILPWRRQLIGNVRVHLKEFMGFEDDDLKRMVLKEPKLFTADKHKILKTFDYLHHTMALPHALLAQFPRSLRHRLHRVKARHLFLVHLGRDQYDPCQESYVSLKRLLECGDQQFCQDVAQSTPDEFHSFLKTL